MIRQLPQPMGVQAPRMYGAPQQQRFGPPAGYNPGGVSRPAPMAPPRPMSMPTGAYNPGGVSRPSTPGMQQTFTQQSPYNAGGVNYQAPTNRSVAPLLDPRAAARELLPTSVAERDNRRPNPTGSVAPIATPQVIQGGIQPMTYTQNYSPVTQYQIPGPPPPEPTTQRGIDYAAGGLVGRSGMTGVPNWSQAQLLPQQPQQPDLRVMARALASTGGLAPRLGGTAISNLPMGNGVTYTPPVDTPGGLLENGLSNQGPAPLIDTARGAIGAMQSPTYRSISQRMGN